MDECRRARCKLWWFWIVGCATLAWTSGAPIESSDGCVTYNIQAYHVHGVDGEDIETGALQQPLKRPPTLGLGSSAGRFVRREQLYREKTKWLRRIDELQSELIAAKMERLGHMDRISDTPISRTSQRLQDQPENDVSKPDVLPAGKIKPDISRNVDPIPEDAAHHGNPDNDLASADVRRFMTDMSLSMKQVQKELKNVKSRNSRLQRTTKRLVGSQRKLHKEYLRSQERLQRLQAFQRSEMARIKWRLGNETNSCEGAVASLRRHVDCMNDPGSCSGGVDGRSGHRTGSDGYSSRRGASPPPGVTVRPTPSGTKTDDNDR